MAAAAKRTLVLVDSWPLLHTIARHVNSNSSIIGVILELSIQLPTANCQHGLLSSIAHSHVLSAVAATAAGHCHLKVAPVYHSLKGTLQSTSASQCGTSDSLLISSNLPPAMTPRSLLLLLFALLLILALAAPASSSPLTTISPDSDSDSLQTASALPAKLFQLDSSSSHSASADSSSSTSAPDPSTSPTGTSIDSSGSSTADSSSSTGDADAATDTEESGFIHTDFGRSLIVLIIIVVVVAGSATFMYRDTLCKRSGSGVGYRGGRDSLLDDYSSGGMSSPYDRL